MTGSSEDTNAMKNLGLLSGNSSSWALAGGVKSLMIGMMGRSGLEGDG